MANEWLSSLLVELNAINLVIILLHGSSKENIPVFIFCFGEQAPLLAEEEG